MPNLAIVDSHLHLWDPRRLSYSWQRGHEILGRPYLAGDYRRACGSVEVAAMVFVECFVDRGLFEPEVRFAEEQAALDPRIKAIVAQASLEEGAAALPFIQHLKDTTPLLRGIRRIIEFEREIDFCRKPTFIQGVKLLGPVGLSFEINVNYRHLEHVLRFVELVDEVPLMLDHCGKPGIREGRLEPWRSQMRALAAHPNVMCKLSDLPVEADHRNWSETQVRPYIDVVVEAFGFERLVYGGDWPVCLQATSLPEWTSLLDRVFAGVHPRELERFYRDNAVRFYHLELPIQ
jgi:L-fuconolactonase